MSTEQTATARLCGGKRLSHLRRRLSVVVVALVLLLACSSNEASERDESQGNGDPSPTSSPSTQVVDALPAFAPFTVGAEVPGAEARTRAAALVQLLTTHGRDRSSIDDLRGRLLEAGFRPTAADRGAELLVPGGTTAGEILFPQLGGLSATNAVVMVVVRQHVASTTGLTSVVRTIVVSVEQQDGAWEPTIESVGGVAIEPPQELEPQIAAFVDHPNIEMSDSVRWDVLRGQVDDRLITILLEVATSRRLSLSAAISGHPAEVFGTNRRSNHAAGRAIDVWAVDGRTVLEWDRSDAGPIADIVRLLLRRGVTEIGAPIDLDGGGTVVFADAVHRDHLHIGFD